MRTRQPYSCIRRYLLDGRHPRIFPPNGGDITLARQEFISHGENSDGADFSSSQLFVDDAIFIEPDLGRRKELVISRWEHGCRNLLGRTAINEARVEMEGVWIATHILLGFEVNVNEMTIQAPTAKRVAAWHAFQDPMLNHGNRIADVKKTQELRGLTNRWSYADRFRHYIAAPVNRLMSFTDSTETRIRCNNDKVWVAFWNLIALIRAMGEQGDDWKNLFCGNLERITPIPKRAGREKGRGKTAWEAGDSALGRIGSINWETREYIWEAAEEFLRELTPARRGIVIGDAEKLAATSIAMAWSSPSIHPLLGTDNRNALEWTRKGGAKKGAALAINQETSKWISDRGAQVEWVYVRRGHNFSPDWLARTTHGEIEKWAEEFGCRRVRLKPAWGEMTQDYRSLHLAEISMPEQRSGRSDDQNFLRLEWNGGWRSFAEASHLFGLKAHFLPARSDGVVNQFRHRYQFMPYGGGDSLLLGGAAKTEADVVDFRQAPRL